MAQTKIKLIADGVIDVNNLKAGHTITTDNIGEGTNLYYTDARVGSYLSTNSYATEGYVTTAVSNLVDAAPSTLDTLNELAAALGDDPNFATTVTNSIATKLPLAGGTISGNLTVSGSLTGTLATAAQPNVTSVGTLSSLSLNNELQINGSSNISTIKTDSDNSLVALIASSALIDNKPRIQIIGTTFASDPNTIQYLAGGHIFKSSAAATEYMRIDSSGNLLVGLTSRVSGLSGFTQLEVSGGEGGITINSNTTTANKYGRLMFTKSGAVGNEGLIRYNVNDYHMSFWTNATERMRIDSSGNVIVGTTTARGPFRIFKDSGANDEFLSLENSKYSSVNNSGETKISFGWGNHIGASIAAYKDGTVNRTGFKIYTEVGWNVPVNTVTFPSAGGIAFNGDTLQANALDDYEEGTWTPVFTGSGANPTYTASVGGHYTKIGRAVNFTLDMNIGTYSGGSGGLRISLPFTVGSYGFQQASIYVSGVNYLADYLTAEPNVGNAFLVIIRINDNTAAAGMLVGAVSGGDIIRITGTYFV